MKHVGFFPREPFSAARSSVSGLIQLHPLPKRSWKQGSGQQKRPPKVRTSLLVTVKDRVSKNLLKGRNLWRSGRKLATLRLVFSLLAVSSSIQSYSVSFGGALPIDLKHKRPNASWVVLIKLFLSKFIYPLCKLYRLRAERKKYICKIVQLSKKSE